MSTVLTAGRKPAQGPAIERGSLTALWQVWAAYTLKRAIAEVASASDQDYRDFGLDRTEILGGLRRARESATRTGKQGARLTGGLGHGRAYRAQ